MSGCQGGSVQAWAIIYDITWHKKVSLAKKLDNSDEMEKFLETNC